ncbi:MAG: VOC family protein [Betaproteobacteria bacterium]|nr:VOC family protein [Betaproteobacteria bacterium]
MKIEAYLFFEGRCEEALAFYGQALGAEVVTSMRYRESPEPPPPGCIPPGSDDRIMHACFRVGDTNVMASDGRCSGETRFQGFSLSLGVTTEAEADRAFAALAQGGEVQMPLGRTFWSPKFGMVTDRFGVTWMVNVLA